MVTLEKVNGIACFAMPLFRFIALPVFAQRFCEDSKKYAKAEICKGQMVGRPPVGGECPEARPSSALAISAALPGGDPLAAALAAGETPTPEMVASAGGTTGLLFARNLQAGRIDRKTTIRGGTFVFAICMVVWLVSANHVTWASEFEVLRLGIAQALSFAGFFVMWYVAVEPLVRRAWPEFLITWVRFTNARFSDPNHDWRTQRASANWSAGNAMTDVTHILSQLEFGDSGAAEQLLPLVYENTAICRCIRPPRELA